MKPIYLNELTITDEHIKLLRAACVDWNACEFGAPTIDPKKPYGTDAVLDSIANLVGVPLPDYEDGEEFAPEIERRLEQLHAETMTALQIFLHTGEMKTGHYRYQGYQTGWVRA